MVSVTCKLIGSYNQYHLILTLQRNLTYILYQTIFLSGPYNFAYYNERILRGLFTFSLEILCQL